jgi:hypothetical protein
VVRIVQFNPDFKDKIFFVYLNKKQNSKVAIASYFSNRGNIEKGIPKINDITNKIIESTTATKFASTLQQHEIAMRAILKQETAKEMLFPDFDGVIKSLGAWGGDFVLSISKDNPIQYFKEKGFETVIPYSEMIL